MAAAYFNVEKCTTAGFKVFEDEIRNDPIGIGIYEDLADQYYKQQLYDKAAETYQSCIKIFSTDASYFTSLGKIYEASNQKDKAEQYYQKGLQLDPSNYESIKSLRKLHSKEKDVYSYFTEPDIDAIVKNAPKASDAFNPDDSYVMLDKEVQRGGL